MSFDKFKNIKTSVSIDTDANYSKILASLPEKKQSARVIGTILSVAAAVILVGAVGMWMLIGGAIRNQGEHIADPLENGETVVDTDKDDDTEVIELTVELKQQLIQFYHNDLVGLPAFDEDNPLSVEQVLRYAEVTGVAQAVDMIFTCEEFSTFAKETFGYDMTLPEDKKYEYIEISNSTLVPFQPTLFELKDDIAKITFTFEDGYKATVRLVCNNTDPLEFGHFVSFKQQEAQTESIKTESTLFEQMEEIAKEYHFYAIHDFEEGTLPDYMRYHISCFAKTKRQFYNDNGGMFLGIPLDEYNELAIKYYGKSDMEGKEPIDFEEQTGILKYADLVKTSDGVYVNLEISGGLESRFEFTDVQYGKTKSGENCVTATFDVYYIGTDQFLPSIKTVCYTTDDNLTPKRFISSSTIYAQSIE